jgi:hypothetical protein
VAGTRKIVEPRTPEIHPRISRIDANGIEAENQLVVCRQECSSFQMLNQFAKKPILWSLAALILGAICFLTLTKPSSPDGYYVDVPGIGCVGDYWLEFSNGKVVWVNYEYEKPELKWKAAYNREVRRCNYSKTNNEWILVPHPKPGAPGVVSRIECSWFGLTITTTNGESEFLRRRFFSGPRPKWLFESDWPPRWAQ